MREKICKKIKNQKGFTLVELIVVLVILAILAAILVPALLGYVDKAREKQYAIEARTVYEATQTYITEEYAKGTYKTRDDLPTKLDTDAALQEISDIADLEVTAITDITYTQYGSGSSAKSASIKTMVVTFVSASNDTSVTGTLRDGAWNFE